MKRGGLFLILALVVALVATLIVCLFSQKASPVDWLKTEFGLNAEQMKQVSALHEEYRATCAGMCVRIVDADAKLTAATRASDALTPAIVAAIAETDRVRTDCRVAMLEHFYKTAAIMPKDKRAKYLEKVLPLVLHPGEMPADHSQ